MKWAFCMISILEKNRHIFPFIGSRLNIHKKVIQSFVGKRIFFLPLTKIVVWQYLFNDLPKKTIKEGVQGRININKKVNVNEKKNQKNIEFVR